MPIAAHAEPLYADAVPNETDGQRVGVLLIHGFSGSPLSMVPWGKDMAERGYGVAVPRLPGHGLTDWKEMNRTGWHDWYGEVERAFEKLRADCDQVVAGGLSMGGSLALRLAEERGNQVAGLLLVNPGLTVDHPLQHIRHVLKFLVSGMPGITNDTKKPGVEEGGYPKTPSRAAASMLDAWIHVIRDLPKVTQPLLMFRSSEDHVVPRSSGDHVMRKVSSRDLTERVLENSFHVATLDYDAPLIFDESAEFVRRVTGP